MSKTTRRTSATKRRRGPYKRRLRSTTVFSQLDLETLADFILTELHPYCSQEKLRKNKGLDLSQYPGERLAGPCYHFPLLGYKEGKKQYFFRNSPSHGHDVRKYLESNFGPQLNLYVEDFGEKVVIVWLDK